MKTVLCYGDSNTWGDPPGGVGRYEWSVRWPGVLQDNLGSDYKVIEEGLCGRTTCIEDPGSLHRNGLAYLPVALETHAPLYLLILMLGTNDLKCCFNLSAFSIAEGATKLVVFAKKFEPNVPNILLISPPHVAPTDNAEIISTFAGAIEKSQELAKHYRYFATTLGCHFYDASTACKSSCIDGIHLDAENHKLLGRGIYREISKILK